MILSTLVAFQALQVANAPIRLPGTHDFFHRSCDAVIAKLEKGDFSGAFIASTVLPKSEFTYNIDLKGIPVKSHPMAKDAVKAAIAKFVYVFPDIKVTQSTKPDVLFTFVSTLPKREGEELPQGVVLFTSIDPKEPRVEAAIAIKRGSPLEFTSNEDLFNAASYAIAVRFGVGEAIVPGRIGYITHQVGYRRNAMSSDDISLLRYNLNVSQSLRRSINKKQKLRPGKPQFQLDTARIELSEVVQGGPQKFSFQVTNLGSSPLMLRLQGDCGCLKPDPRATIDPTATTLVHGAIDTYEVYGLMNQNILIWTNDPDQPFIELPIKFKVTPSTRILMPQGQTRYVESGDIEHEMYLTLAEGIELKPTKFNTSGLNATFTHEPWTGTLPDPELKEDEKPRRGYKFTLRIKKSDIPPGRNGVTLLIGTDHPIFSVLRGTFYVQTGIVAFPDSLYLGRLPQTTKSAAVLLVRPGRPFGITQVESSAKWLIAKVVKDRNKEEYRLSVQLDGSQPKGQLTERIIITTDDPAQPKLILPVSAIIE